MLRIIDKFVQAVAVLIFAVSSLLIFLNVLNRYMVLGWMRGVAKNNESFRPAYFIVRDFFSSLTIMADEVPGLLLVWIAFLGAYLVMRRDGHISFDLILLSLPDAIRRVLKGIIEMLMCSFLAVLFWQSVRMIRVSGRMEIDTAKVPQGWFMLIMPIAAVLLLLAMLNHVFRRQNSEKAAG